MSDPVFLALDELEKPMSQAYHAARLADAVLTERMVGDGPNEKDGSGRWVYRWTDDEVGDLFHAVEAALGAVDRARKALAAGFAARRKPEAKK